MPCPLCDKKFVIPSGGVEKLPGHFMVQKLIEINNESATVVPDEIIGMKCDICTDVLDLLSQHCLDCCETLCCNCGVINLKARATKSHQVAKVGS